MGKYTSIYYEILDYLDDLLKIMNQDNVECNTELKKDFQIISQYSLPFMDLEESLKIKDELISLLNEKPKDHYPTNLDGHSLFEVFVP